MSDEAMILICNAFVVEKKYRKCFSFAQFGMRIGRAAAVV
jgi:hypothetical protein